MALLFSAVTVTAGDEEIEFMVRAQIPVGIILYEMKKGLNKRFFQKKHEKHLIFLSEYGIIRLYFIR